MVSMLVKPNIKEMVVPQPVGFCILKKRAIFPCLAHHFLVRRFLTKCSFRSSVHSLLSCQSGRLTKMGLLATSEKIQKHIQQAFREECQVILQRMPSFQWTELTLANCAWLLIQSVIRELQDYRVSNMHVCIVKFSLTVHHDMVTWWMLHLILYRSCWHVWHSDCMFCFTHRNICVMLKIQLLRWKLDSIILKSSEGFAAVYLTKEQ